ncbi:hypothetical protein DYB26_009639, partial [Aphanomyces astaci]
KGLHELLERNRLWAESVVESAPFFFQKLSKQQSPEILWIVHSDMNCLSVIEYAVVHLKVKHIIVCTYPFTTMDVAESNMRRQLYDPCDFSVCHTRIVQKAWKRGHSVSVHGWCYSIDDGIIRDLNICVSEDTQIEPIYRRMMQKRSSVMGFDDMTSSKMAEMLHSLSHSSSTVT